MADVQSAFLCNSALAHENGTASVLGLGIRTWSAPQFPFVVALTFVAVIVWSPEEAGRRHFISALVSHPDGEVVHRSDFEADAPIADSPLPPLTTLYVGTPFEARRGGIYEVNLLIDGASQTSLPLLVESSLPPIG